MDSNNNISDIKLLVKTGEQEIFQSWKDNAVDQMRCGSIFINYAKWEAFEAIIYVWKLVCEDRKIYAKLYYELMNN